MKISHKNKLFWKKKIKLLKWDKIPKQIFKSTKSNSFRWFSDGKINLYENLITKNLKKNKDKIAVITVSKDKQITRYCYGEIDNLVNVFYWNLMNEKKKIKRVMIHSSASINSTISMLSCIKGGIFFSVIFDELPKKAIISRINLFKPDIFITNKINLKNFLCKNFKKIRFLNFKKLFKKQNISYTKSLSVKSNKDFFCLFTSGSTGEPKGVVHNYGGYSIYAKYTCQNQFGMNVNSVVLTASDAGWINGHTYSLFGPLLFGSTTILCETPMLLLNLKLLKNVLKLGVTIVYLPVTLIRILKSLLGNPNLKSKKIKSIGSMGEPLAPAVGKWYIKSFFNEKKAIVNTYFQTETGGIVMSPKYSDSSKKSPHGSVGDVVSTNLKYRKLNKIQKSEIILTQPWPGCMKRLLNKKKEWNKYWTLDNNFRMFDYATKKNKSISIHGRIDDVINIRGHRIGSEELESTVLSNTKVKECCAISISDEIEGNKFNLFLVASNKNVEANIVSLIEKTYGSYAIPNNIHFLPELPKTRSGKILRRLLRSLVNNSSNIGDISTMMNPNIIKIIKNKLNENKN